MTLQGFRDALLTVGPPVHHYAAAKETDSYIVWAEHQLIPYNADNGQYQVTYLIQAAHLTKTEFDPAAMEIMRALESRGVTLRKILISHDRETGYTQTLIDCEMIYG